jgi:hypothetical protein
MVELQGLMFGAVLLPPCRYSTTDLSGKAACKRALQREMRLPLEPDLPIIGFIGRLDYQKGPDLIMDALPFLSNLDCQVRLHLVCGDLCTCSLLCPSINAMGPVALCHGRNMTNISSTNFNTMLAFIQTPCAFCKMQQ